MRVWSLVHIESRRVAAEFVQDDPPAEEYLSAFRRFGDPAWDLISRELPPDEEDERHRQRRAEEYPPLSDMADAIYWREKGNPDPLAAWVAACDAVRERNRRRERDK